MYSDRSAKIIQYIVYHKFLQMIASIRNLLLRESFTNFIDHLIRLRILIMQ